MVEHFLFRLVRRSAVRQTAQQDGPEITFGLCWQIRFAVVLIVVGIGSLLFMLLRTPPVAGDPWYLKPIIVTILAALPISVLLALPGRIVTDSDGIHQRYWWRSERRLPWTDVVSVARNQSKGQTIVYGKFASPIVFSHYLVDSSRFEREVKSHSHRFDPGSDL